MNRMTRNLRILSVFVFSMLFAWILTFLFEGQVLYSLLQHFGKQTDVYILSAIVAHLAGLFSCGFLVKSPQIAKHVMASGMLICLAFSIPFFFAPSVLWLVALILMGYIAGCSTAAWGYYLKTCTPKHERIKSCADVLIVSNLIMIAINVVAIKGSPFIGLTLSMLCLVVGFVLTCQLPVEAMISWKSDTGKKVSSDMRKPMAMLFLFVSVITINSGLMYQVINPAFEHLTGLVSWYWAVPYIVALTIMRNLPLRFKRSIFLYVGMSMIIGAFISFMLLGRGAGDYLIVDTLMLGACGIFDLFWWSIIADMLDFSENPVKIFGIGLSANVFGVLGGGVLGVTLTSMQLPSAEVAVIALTVVCVTLVLLPLLNHELLILLKNHAYLVAYKGANECEREAIIHKNNILDPLTNREQEVLELILSGKSNKAIAELLFISESTVKTHARNIYSKYYVSSRAELISTLLKS